MVATAVADQEGFLETPYILGFFLLLVDNSELGL